jgi:hypothetical protein
VIHNDVVIDKMNTIFSPVHVMFPFLATLRAKHRESDLGSLMGYGETGVLYTCLLHCIIGLLVCLIQEGVKTFVSSQSQCVVRERCFSVIHVLGNKICNVE